VDECECEERWGPEGRPGKTKLEEAHNRIASLEQAVQLGEDEREGLREALLELCKQVDDCERDYGKRMRAAEEDSHEYRAMWHSWVAYNCVRYWLSLLRDRCPWLFEEGDGR
jgi:vacuolar-type H+-ATPase subunit D/Vma8